MSQLDQVPDAQQVSGDKDDSLGLASAQYSQSLQSTRLHSITPSPLHTTNNNRSAIASTRSSTSSARKNFTWKTQDVEGLVSALYNNETYQLALLPSRKTRRDESSNKLRKITFWRSIFVQIFPGSTYVDPDRIKTKVRWLLDTYRKEKKKLSLTGAGFLEGVDPSDPTYIPHALLARKYPWFAKMHEMMSDRFTATPAFLTGSVGIDDSSDGEQDNAMEDRANNNHHGPRGRGLPPIHDLMESVNTSREGRAISPALSGYHLSPAHSQRSESAAPAPSPSPATPSPATPSTPRTSTSAGKRKRGSLEQKISAVAEAYLQAKTERMQYYLKLEEERTKQEKYRFELEQLKIKADKEQKAATIRMLEQQSQLMVQMIHFLGERSPFNFASSSNSNSSTQ
ncbi:uncharacterized protein SPSC_04004 [Sporisorium scitamineum]|uniref:Uncharacterized protein n=1 Tax=Sporisorium scitamineum TaxID=49012 RepID=A0A127ZGC9_9BASI|nr:uncharacterized protein SPSC_04004 [Sporisorium scitamineum]